MRRAGRPAPVFHAGPKNSQFASCAGPLKSIGSVAVPGLVVLAAVINQPGSSKASLLLFSVSLSEGTQLTCLESLQNQLEGDRADWRASGEGIIQDTDSEDYQAYYCG